MVFSLKKCALHKIDNKKYNKVASGKFILIQETARFTVPQNLILRQLPIKIMTVIL